MDTADVRVGTAVREGRHEPCNESVHRRWRGSLTGLIHQLDADRIWKICHLPSDARPEPRKGRPPWLTEEIPHRLLRQDCVADGVVVGSRIDANAARVEKIVVGIAREECPCRLIVATVGMKAKLRYRAVWQLGPQRPANERGCCLLAQPHGHAPTAVGAAHHVAVLLEDDVDAVSSAQEDDFSEVAEKVSVKDVFGGLRPGPSHGEPNDIPVHRVGDVARICCIEGVARGSFSVIADSLALDTRQIRWTFHDDLLQKCQSAPVGEARSTKARPGV